MELCFVSFVYSVKFTQKWKEITRILSTIIQISKELDANMGAKF